MKYWFSISDDEQHRRFLMRMHDPLKQWKLSPMDLESLDRWEAYTEAKEAMFFYTDTADAPWTVVKSNDKKRARLEAMRHVLAQFDYADKRLQIQGHTDADPIKYSKWKSNQDLSVARANAVKAYLVQKGIEAPRAALPAA